MGSWSRILLSILMVVLGLALTTMLINWHV
ncbi:hypothetical protein ACM25_02630 [Helicobacter pylori]|nr:hypothetical protein HPY173_04765 [Helicobacter pylori]KNE07910.1 hypothetical protein ACM25_02630 [Helicobacter pylori]